MDRTTNIRVLNIIAEWAQRSKHARRAWAYVEQTEVWTLIDADSINYRDGKRKNETCELSVSVRYQVCMIVEDTVQKL